METSSRGCKVSLISAPHVVHIYLTPNSKYARSLDSLPDEVRERSTSKSAVSRRYVALTTKQLTAWLTTPLGDRHFPIVLIDGIILGDHTVLIALGLDSEGRKQILGLREGHT